MIDYSDERWQHLIGGYKLAFDPTPLLQRLESGEDVKTCWDELWENLYHQGDIGDAIYPTIAKLIELVSTGALKPDWNFYTLVGTAELEQYKGAPLPDWPEANYTRNLNDLYTKVIADFPHSQGLEARAMLGLLALYKEQYVAAEIILNTADDEMIGFAQGMV